LSTNQGEPLELIDGAFMDKKKISNSIGTNNAAIPPLPDKTPGVNKFKYKPNFGVIVICEDEAHHKAVYEQLQSQGYKCKVVRV